MIAGVRSTGVLVALVLVLGCTKAPPPNPVELAERGTAPASPPADAVAPSDASLPSDASGPSDASVPSDASPIDASVPLDASARRVVKVPGRGACKTDAECVLTTFQEGCCVQACQGYASSKLELAARQAKENCAARGPAICPPPSPCRVPTHTVLAAACSAQRCVSVEAVLP